MAKIVKKKHFYRRILIEAAFLLLIAYVGGFLKYQVRLGHDLLGSDSFMHVVRLENIAAKGSLHESTFTRLNAPYGADLHWTMPLDALTLALAAPFSWNLGWNKALLMIAPFMGPLLHLLVLIAALWAFLPFLEGWALRLSVLMLVVSPLLINYGLYGVVDHHLLILAAWIYFGGWLARTLSKDAPPNGALMLAVSAALCLWISPESYPGIIFGVAILAASWTFRFLPKDDALKTFARAFPALILLILWLDPPRSGMMDVDYERLSALTLVFGLLIGAACGVLLIYPARKKMRIKTRFVLSVSAFSAAATAFLIIFPGFLNLRSSYDVNTWLTAHIEEFVSPLRMKLPFMLVSIIRPLLGAAVLILFWRKERKKKTRWIWAAVAIPYLFYLIWGLRQWRFLFYSDVFAVFLLARYAQISLNGMEKRRRKFPLVSAQTLLFIVFLAGPWIPSVIASALKIPNPYSPSSSSGSAVQTCRLDQITPFLNDPLFIPNQSSVVATELGNAGELLFRTHHQVLAGPYEEPTGPRDLMNFLYDYPEAKAKEIADSRGIDYVLVCTQRDESFRLPHPDSIFKRIVENNPPAFLKRKSWPEKIRTSFQLYQVRKER